MNQGRGITFPWRRSMWSRLCSSPPSMSSWAMGERLYSGLIAGCRANPCLTSHHPSAMQSAPESRDKGRWLKRCKGTNESRTSPGRSRCRYSWTTCKFGIGHVRSNCRRTNRTGYAGGGHRIESSPPLQRTWLSSLGSTRSKVQNCSVKRVLRPSASSSFGLCSGQVQVLHLACAP